MKRIIVNVSKKYDVFIGNGILTASISLIREVVKTSRVAIITDDIVDKLYADCLQSDLLKQGFKAIKFVFKNGEEYKKIETLSEILEFLAEKNFKRNDAVIALGGGVVGDISGLAAAMYMRGINFIQIPTTLLSMVDASIGGKTAIDLKHGKNLAGAFWQPRLVICDCDIVRHLPDDIFEEGMAEVIKCGAIREYDIIKSVLDNSVMVNLESIIESCIKLKRDVVEADEFETKGVRKILNAGHTVAHSIEKLSNYTISHGLAVGTGLVLEAKLAKNLGILKDDSEEILENCVRKYNLLVDVSYNIESFIKAMKSDKKNSDDKISFMLPESLGNYKEYKLEASDLLSCL